MSTTYKTVAGDTFDSIARKIYGDDKKAALVQRSNSGVQEPMNPGTEIRVPDLPGWPSSLTGK